MEAVILDLETKCKIAIYLKKSLLMIPVVGIWAIIEALLKFNLVKKDIIMLITGSKNFLELGVQTQRFIIAILILCLAIIFHLIGKFLYSKWICHKIDRGR